MQPTRRQFLAGLAGAAAAAACDLPAGFADAPAPLTRWEERAQLHQRMTGGVTWLTHEPIEFLLRRGDHPDGLAEQYAKMIDPDNIRRMADAGIKYGRMFFYKGFGVEYERKNMETAARTAELMHSLGMKISLYIGGTMFVETLYREVPEAINWEQRDQDNHWVSYGEQTFRHYACPNEPAYRQYVKRAIKFGVEQARADQFAFDNIMLQAEPRSCHCPRCKQAFTEFLHKRYPTEADARRRFGIASVEAIHMHQWDSAEQAAALQSLNDPVLQEWVRFRCESLANFAGDFYDYVKSLNPATETNFNIKGIFSFNRYWTNAVYHPLYKGRIDSLSFDTGGYDERIDSRTGALVSQIRSYKMARRIDAGCEDSLADEVRAAVHMAFGVQKASSAFVGTPFGSGGQAVFNALMEFFRQYNAEFYTDTANVADVGVYRTWASMAYSMNEPYVPLTLIEQVLIQYKVPWDMLFDDQNPDLTQYKAIVVAGQECLSDQQAAKLMDYATNHGCLILAGATAKYDERRQTRQADPFAGVGGTIVRIAKIERAGRRAAGATADQDPEPAPQEAREPRLSPAQWVLPPNHRAIFDSIAAAVALSIQTEAPLTTVMELVTRAARKQTIAHFVNFDKHAPTAAFAASVKKQFDGPVKSVKYFSPDADQAAALDFTEAAGRVKFTVPATRVYGMVVIQ